MAVHARLKEAFSTVPRQIRGFDLGSLQLDVVVFDDVPSKGARTVVTAGLGAHVGQELLFCCLAEQFVPDVLKLVGSVARELVARGAGLRVGEVLGPSGPLLPNVRAEAFYACTPVYFGDALEDPLTTSAGSHVHFLWLVPLLATEAVWLRTHEPIEFAEMLEHQDPDLLDLCRAPIELA